MSDWPTGLHRKQSGPRTD